MTKTLNIDSFKTLLNQQLQIQFAPNVLMHAELIEVKAMEFKDQPNRKSFSILLRTAQKGEYYQQGTFKVTHTHLGEHMLFMVPIGPDDKGMCYEAMFN